jgi:hypothetical protein
MEVARRGWLRTGEKREGNNPFSAIEKRMRDQRPRYPEDFDASRFDPFAGEERAREELLGKLLLEWTPGDANGVGAGPSGPGSSAGVPRVTTQLPGMDAPGRAETVDQTQREDANLNRDVEEGRADSANLEVEMMLNDEGDPTRHREGNRMKQPHSPTHPLRTEAREFTTDSTDEPGQSSHEEDFANIFSEAETPQVPLTNKNGSKEHSPVKSSKTRPSKHIQDPPTQDKPPSVLSPGLRRMESLLPLDSPPTTADRAWARKVVESTYSEDAKRRPVTTRRRTEDYSIGNRSYLPRPEISDDEEGIYLHERLRRR